MAAFIRLNLQMRAPGAAQRPLDMVPQYTGMKRVRDEDAEEEAALPPPPKRARHAPQTLIDDRGAVVTYEPDFFDAADATRLFDALLASTPWQDEQVRMRGKTLTARRRVCSYGDDNVAYTYAGIRRPPLPWAGPIKEVRRLVEAGTGELFNYGLLNLYRDGMDVIGFHADKEADLEPGSTIASVSLGATRDFVLKPGGAMPSKAAATAAAAAAQEAMPKGTDAPAPVTLQVSVALAHGSLLCMKGRTQQLYKHAVPPRKRVTTPRINITFRQLRKKQRVPGSRKVV